MQRVYKFQQYSSHTPSLPSQLLHSTGEVFRSNFYEPPLLTLAHHLLLSFIPLLFTPNWSFQFLAPSAVPSSSSSAFYRAGPPWTIPCEWNISHCTSPPPSPILRVCVCGFICVWLHLFYYSLFVFCFFLLLLFLNFFWHTSGRRHFLSYAARVLLNLISRTRKWLGLIISFNFYLFSR